MEYNEKQVQIMEASELLFAEQGFNGTSVRDISDKANVNLAMVSYYFGSKEKLLEAIFTYRGELAKMKLEGIISKPGLSSMDKVNLLIDHYIDKVMSHQCFHRILAREQVLNTAGPIADLIMNMKRKNQELIAKLVHEGQKSGEFKKGVDVPLMIATLIGTANNLITTKHYYKELSNLQSMGEEEFTKHLRKKLGQHLKQVFKIILTHES